MPFCVRNIKAKNGGNKMAPEEQGENVTEYSDVFKANYSYKWWQKNIDLLKWCFESILNI